MDQSKQRAIRFLTKEIETYKALALFLSKVEVKRHLRGKDDEDLTRPTYYKERIREARKLVKEFKASH